MCLAKGPRKTREIVLALMTDYPVEEHSAGVPYRALLKALRPKHHHSLVGLEELLASGQEPSTRLTGPALRKFRDLLASVEDCVRRGPKDSAIDQSAKIIDGYVPTMADVRLIYQQFDLCGHQYVEQKMHQLRKACEKNTCGCCPAEFVPQRAYLVLSQQSETLAEERRLMLPFAKLYHRATFRNPLAMAEHRGFADAMRSVRVSIGTGSIAGSTDHSIPHSEIRSPEILHHLDRIQFASDLASKLFPLYYFARGEPVSDERFIAEWSKPLAGRLAKFMNSIRNFILVEVNEMLAPDLAQPLPRIEGTGVFPEDWLVQPSAAEVKPDLDELKLEFEVLMRFALDHRGDDPLPQPAKPRRRPTPPGPRGAQLMPRPLRSKLPHKKKPQEGGVRTPRRRPSPPP